MKNILISFTCIAGLALIFCIGCETDSASEPVRVSPNSVSIRQGQQIEFEAFDGYQYTWSLENDSWGTLSTRTGSRTTYTSTYTPASNSTEVTQILTCTSTIEGSATGSNATPYAVTGQATITHM